MRVGRQNVICCWSPFHNNWWGHKVVPWDKQHLHRASQVGPDTFLYELLQFTETKYLIPKQKSLLMLVSMMSECRGAGLHDKQVVSIGIPCHHTQAEYLNCAIRGPECRVPLVPIPGGGVWVYLVWCPSGICTRPPSDPTVTQQ